MVETSSVACDVLGRLEKKTYGLFLDFVGLYVQNCFQLLEEKR